MDPQERQKYLLKGEIRLLEKQRDDLLSSLERLDVSHREAVTQNTKQIKDLTTRKTELIEQVERLRDTMTLLTDAYNKSKESMELFTKTKLVDTNKECEALLASARGTEAKATEKLKEAEEKEKELEIEEKHLENEKIILKTKTEEYIRATIALDARKLSDQKDHQRWEETLHDLQVTKGELERDIAGLTDSKKELQLFITSENSRLVEENKKLESKRQEVQILTTAQLQRDKIQNERQKALDEEQRLIVDRRGTLERAEASMKNKGVTI